MRHFIGFLVLLGGLCAVVCNPLYAKTFYVADNGSNTDGLSWETAFTTIQAAVNAAEAAAQTDPNTFTILVGSAEAGHGSGMYIENIDISLSGLTLVSESGCLHTFLEAASGSDHVISVSADSITIRGFSISGAGSTGFAGIALSNARFCTVENNRCGWEDGTAYPNYRGILLLSSEDNTIRNNLCSSNTNDGIHLSASTHNQIVDNFCSGNGNAGIALQNNSHQNEVIGNTCLFNDDGGLDADNANLNRLALNTCSGSDSASGINLSNALNNVVTQNFCSENRYGIEITSSCQFNSISQNDLQNNTFDGLSLKGDWNQIVGNRSRHNGRFGLYVFASENNTFYLNTSSGNDSAAVYVYYYAAGTGDRWASPTPLCYADTKDRIYVSSMGNYYDLYAGSDPDGDGIGEEPFPLHGDVQDDYPLMDSNTAYAVQAWYPAGGQRMTMDPNQKGLWRELEAGGSAVWLSETVALEAIEFAALDSQDGWNGQLRVNTGGTFEIEVGYADPQDGIFIGSGAVASVSGTSTVLTFETAGQSFTVEPGKALALRITNLSGGSRQLYVGGVWSYITAPAGTATPWPGQAPLPPVNPGDLDGDGWVDMNDLNILMASWGMTGCDEGNDYCQRADIDQSGQVGQGDLELLAVYWLMGPGDRLAGDWNEDFKVNMEDLAILSGQWIGQLEELGYLCENWLLGTY